MFVRYGFKLIHTNQTIPLNKQEKLSYAIISYKEELTQTKSGLLK